MIISRLIDKGCMMIVNINEAFGDSVEFDTVQEMAECIQLSGYDLPFDGLREGRDYQEAEE
jgi:hypothetical protein